MAWKYNPFAKKLDYYTEPGVPGAHASSHVTGGSDVIADAISGGASGLLSGTDKSFIDGIPTNYEPIGAAAAERSDHESDFNHSNFLSASSHAAETTGRHPWLTTALSTGLLWGGVPSINGGDATKFNISAGAGVIVDNHTDPANPTRKIVTWDAMTAVTDTYRTTADETGLAIERTAAGDGTGTLVQQDTSLYTAEQRRDLIVIGWTSHVARGNLESAEPEPYFAASALNQIQDYMENFFSHFNIVGNEYAPAASGLGIQRSAGEVFDLGANYSTSKKSPNILVTDLENPVADLYYSYRDSAGDWVNDDAPLSAVDPDYYDKGVGFGKTAVTSGKFTIQTINFYGIWAATEIQYGQALYDDKASAKAAINSPIVVNPWLEYDVFRCWLVIQQGTTDFSDSAKFEFIPAGRLGLLSVVAGGGTGGEVNTASNQGTGGVGLYHGKVGVDLQFRNINAGSNKVTVTLDTPNKEVDIDVAPGNIAHQGLSGAGTNDHSAIDSHISATTSAHGGILASTVLDGPTKITCGTSVSGTPNTNDLWIDTN